MWKSFRGSGVGIGTLFHYAKHGGWEDGSKKLYEEWCRKQAPPKDDERDGLREWDFGEDASLPPPREWLLGATFCRTFLSSLLAAGGVGKTALRYAQFLSLATGRNLTGEHVHLRCRVLVISLEDDENELKRRMLALMKYHGISHDDVRGWLFVSAPGRSAGKLLEADPLLGGPWSVLWLPISKRRSRGESPTWCHLIPSSRAILRKRTTTR